MSDTVSAIREGSRTVLHDQKASMREIVAGLSAEALNWRPAVQSDANSIAQMLSHALDAERYLMSASVDVSIERDREKHFRVEGVTAEELTALIDQVSAEVDGYLDQLTAEHLSSDIARPGRTFTGAWWLLHAIEHSREHVGQAYLTRQLWEEKA